MDSKGQSLQEFRAAQIEQDELWEELKVENMWVHLLRGMFTRGTAAKIGPTAFFVYGAIKCHVNLETGHAFPSIETLAEQTDLSHDTIQRAIKKLTQHGLIKVDKRGRNNHYSLMEQVPILTSDRKEVFGTAERKYVPLQFQHFIEELQRVAKTGNPPTDKAINITINVQNIVQRDGGTVTMNVQSIQLPEAAAALPSTSVQNILNKALKKIHFD